MSVTVCLGQPVVELVRDGDAFTPRLGGAGAKLAVAAASAGARIALAGAAGDDQWGHWVRDRLARDGVDVSELALLPGFQTPITFGSERYGDSPVPPPVDVARAVGVVVCAEVLADGEQRAAAMGVRSQALELDRPLVFDASLSGSPWRSRADAAASANACVAGALLICADHADAALMTGEDDPERAAMALLKAGARLALITGGPDGAILRGEFRRDVDGPLPALGEVVAKLALSDFYPPVVAAALA